MTRLNWLSLLGLSFLSGSLGVERFLELLLKQNTRLQQLLYFAVLDEVGDQVLVLAERVQIPADIRDLGSVLLVQAWVLLARKLFDLSD